MLSQWVQCLAPALVPLFCGLLLQSSPSTGSLEGRVLFHGDPPPPTRIENTTDPEICGEEQTLQDLVVSQDGGIRYVLAALTGVPPERTPPIEPRVLVLDNRDCRFVPHAAVVTVGSTLRATNSDPLLHTTHLYGPVEVNFSLPVKGVESSRTLSRPGLYVVKCDIHGWMQAFVRVGEHPYHAVTDSSGAFRIQGIPSGSYTLELWHERLGALEREITIDAGTTTEVTIEYREEEVP